MGEKGKVEQASSQGLSENWWANDGVVPLASQFHPFNCHPDRCRHFKGMPASLPFGRRRPRPESTDFKLHSPAPSLTPLSPHSETATPVDVHDDTTLSPNQSGTEQEKPHSKGTSLPVPATHTTKTDRSMLSTARSAAKIAYLTSLRAINQHDPPLLTPSEEELRSFLPQPPPPPSTPTSSINGELKEEEDQKESGAIRELLNPRDNQWYTFEIDNLDHTSLCPFWTGSEVQKQFWTGRGWFLASVDRKAGFRVEVGVESR